MATSTNKGRGENKQLEQLLRVFLCVYWFMLSFIDAQTQPSLACSASSSWRARASLRSRTARTIS